MDTVRIKKRLLSTVSILPQILAIHACQLIAVGGIRTLTLQYATSPSCPLANRLLRPLQPLPFKISCDSFPDTEQPLDRLLLPVYTPYENRYTGNKSNIKTRIEICPFINKKLEA